MTRPGRTTGTMAVVGGLTILLGGATFMVIKSLVATPSTTTAGEPVRSEGGEDIDGALTAAHKLIDAGPDSARQAIIVLDRAIAVYPNNQDLRLALAKARMALKEWGPALDQLKEAVRIGPATAPLLFQAGTVADDAGRLDEAIELYTRAQFADPREPSYSFNLAMVQIKLNQDSAARTSLVRVVNMDKENARAWGTLAQLELKTNELSLAEQHIAEARTREPDFVRWRVVNARILSRLNKPQQALDLLIGLTPADRLTEGALLAMADALGLLKQPAKAAKLYEDAFITRAGDAELAFQAAVWHQRAGNASAAKDYATQAATLGHAGAKKMLADFGG